MPVQLHPVDEIINVQWEGGTAFLYSGADGMFGSEDGEKWVKAEAAVPAISLACIDGVWIACNPFEATWRSEDGAVTWKAVAGFKFEEVAAMRPKGTDAEGNPMPGVFAGWLMEDDNHVVYTSHDLGETWSIALSIPTSIPFGDNENGYERIQGLSGCGESAGFFVCTIKGDSRYANGDGMIYTSLDGNSFIRQLVFGPGTNFIPGPPGQPTPELRGFTALAVAYDTKSNSYIAIGAKQTRSSSTAPVGIVTSHMIYTIGSGSSFSQSEGTIAASAQIMNGFGDFLQVDNTAAGGKGLFIGGFGRNPFEAGQLQGEGTTHAIIIPGNSQQTMENRIVTSFCFKPALDSADEGSADESLEDGTFACVSYDNGGSGGAYIRTDGFFRKTHSGRSIGGLGAVAVGTVDFLGEDESAP